MEQVVSVKPSVENIASAVLSPSSQGTGSGALYPRKLSQVKKIITKTTRQPHDMLVPQRQANLRSDRPRSFRSTVYQYDSRSKPKSKLTGLGANLNQRVA